MGLRHQNRAAEGQGRHDQKCGDDEDDHQPDTASPAHKVTQPAGSGIEHHSEQDTCEDQDERLGGDPDNGDEQQKGDRHGGHHGCARGNLRRFCRLTDDSTADPSRSTGWMEQPSATRLPARTSPANPADTLQRTYCHHRSMALGCALAAVLALAPAQAATPAANQADADNSLTPSLAPMLQKVLPGIVSIGVRGSVAVKNPMLSDPFFRQFFGQPQGGQPQKRQFQALGSGVIVDAKNGYVLTNDHVVQHATSITVGLGNGQRVPGKLIGADQPTDLAVVQIKADNLTAVPMADSSKLRVGDYVVAVGNPFGLSQTVTFGIVSALGRTGLGIENYEDFIQTDASINPGNSGGGLVDVNGDLVGINSAILGRSGNIGIGFAIPSQHGEGRDGAAHR